MAHLQMLLLLLLAGFSLSLAADSAESADGSYFFLFNDDDKNSTDDDDHHREFERTRDDMHRLLNNRTNIRNEFQFNKARGFLLAGNLTQDELQAMRRQMGKRGTLVPNRRIKLDLPSKVEVLQTKPLNVASSGPSAAATCTGKKCCGRTVSLSYNTNLDWLDRTRNGKFCAPADDTTKMDVFVLDTGVDSTHPELAGRVVTVEDCSVNGPAPWTANVDVVGHGTHVSGTIGSTSYGVTPNVNIHMVKVLNDQGSGSDANLVCGFNKVEAWLKSNPTKKAVVSLSLGYSGISTVINSVTTSLATTYASRLVIVVASGNSNVKGCSVTLASVNAVVAVGSTGATLSESSFSNYGSCVDILAPGENILSTYPTNQYARMSGTSMATPLVSGVLAQYWLQNPNMTGLAIRTAISSTSNPLFAPIVINRKSGTPNKLIQYTCPFSVCV